MINSFFVSAYLFVTLAFSSETSIDFQAVDVTANSVGPSLQMIVERRSRLGFDPYKFEELCFESNEVINKYAQFADLIFKEFGNRVQ